MTLSRSRPFPSHTWPQGYDAGPPQTCETCGTEWREGYEDPPPWKCKAGGLKRTSGPAPVNPERRRRRRVDGDTDVRHTYGPYHRWIKTRPCYVRHHEDHECDLGPSGHHVKHVGNGGRDPANEVPLCEAAHRELHTCGNDTFEKRYGVSLQKARWKLWDLFRQVRPEMAEKLAGWTPVRKSANGGE